MQSQRAWLLGQNNGAIIVYFDQGNAGDLLEKWEKALADGVAATGPNRLRLQSCYASDAARSSLPRGSF